MSDNEIVPAASYEIQAIHEGCDESAENSYSDRLTINTSMWGDIAGDYETTPCTPPDGTVDFVDIAVMADKFKNLPGAPRCPKITWTAVLRDHVRESPIPA